MSVDGKHLGEHMGLAFFTLGQRKGIGLGGSQDGTGDAWYVARKDVANNTLYVAQGHDHPWLLSERLAAIDASWIAGHEPPLGQYSAKTRYRQEDALCAITAEQDNSFELQFKAAQWQLHQVSQPFCTKGTFAWVVELLFAKDYCAGGVVCLNEVRSDNCAKCVARFGYLVFQSSSGNRNSNQPRAHPRAISARLN